MSGMTSIIDIVTFAPLPHRLLGRAMPLRKNPCGLATRLDICPYLGCRRGLDMQSNDEGLCDHPGWNNYGKLESVLS